MHRVTLIKEGIPQGNVQRYLKREARVLSRERNETDRLKIGYYIPGRVRNEIR